MCKKKKKTRLSFASQLKVHRMLNAISRTITGFENGRFAGFKDVSAFHLEDNDLSSAALPSPVVFI